MLWKTRDGQVIDLCNAENTHLLAILRMIRNFTVELCRKHGITLRRGAAAQFETLMEQAPHKAVQEAVRILRSRNVAVPLDILPENYWMAETSGTPDLTIPPKNIKQFDPKSKKLQAEVAILRKEREIPKKRTRSILDYPSTTNSNSNPEPNQP